MSSSADFESINLGLSSQITRDVTLRSIPDSTSGDEDLDPNEFIQRTDTHTDILSTDPPLASSSKFPLVNSFDTLRTSDLYKSQESLGNTVIFPVEFNKRSGDEPIEFISNRIKLLYQELQDNSRKHESYLKSGDPNLYRIRSMISQNYDLLSESYYSVNELYSKDLTNTESLQSSFQKWDSRRMKVLNKIREIKSENSKYGSKLAELLNRSQDIDNEVDALEAKLEELKNKKQVINKEIQDTSSVLESKTAKYVDLFKTMEQQGRSAIVGFLQSNGIPESEIDVLVKSTPVDVAFKSQTTKSGIITPKKSVQPEKPTIGMQPYIPDILDQPIPQDPQEMNYGHGPTPYEKGYAKGTEKSQSVKKQIRKAMNVIFESIPESKPRSTTIKDDFSNNITDKIELDPVLHFLEHKVEALSDLILKSSKKASVFHEFSIIWNELTKVLTLSEGKLQNTLTESTNIDSISSILTTSLQHSKVCLDKIQIVTVDKDDLSQRQLLEKVVKCEIHGIIEGMKLISQGNEFNDIGEYENLGISQGKDKLKQG